MQPFVIMKPIITTHQLSLHIELIILQLRPNEKRFFVNTLLAPFNNFIFFLNYIHTQKNMMNKTLLLKYQHLLNHVSSYYNLLKNT